MTYEELIHLLKTSTTVDEINSRREEIADLVPESRIMFDFDQRNHAHPYDLWIHSIHTVLGLPRSLDDDALYLAALFHDIGKPSCQKPPVNESDVSFHYPGHPVKSREIAEDIILPRIIDIGAPLSSHEKELFIYYVAHHDDHMKISDELVKEYLEDISLEEFHHLMLLEVSDAIAHVQLPIIAERVRVCRILSVYTLSSK